MDDTLFALTLTAALGCGIVAGVFFAFSTFVMSALARLPSAQGIAAMQSINITVITPLFMLALFGTALACVALGVLAVVDWDEPEVFYQLPGSALYVVGTTLVTMVFNVPRNNALAALDPASAASEAYWRRYLSSWTAWNHVRTAAAFAATVLLTIALIEG